MDYFALQRSPLSPLFPALNMLCRGLPYPHAPFIEYALQGSPLSPIPYALQGSPLFFITDQ